VALETTSAAWLYDASYWQSYIFPRPVPAMKKDPVTERVTAIIVDVPHFISSSCWTCLHQTAGRVRGLWTAFGTSRYSSETLYDAGRRRHVVCNWQV